MDSILEYFNAVEDFIPSGRATGHARADSDVDFLVIAESDLPRQKRSYGLYALIHPYLFAMETIVYTPEEVDQRRRDPTSFVSNLLTEGKEVSAG